MSAEKLLAAASSAAPARFYVSEEFEELATCFIRVRGGRALSVTLPVHFELIAQQSPMWIGISDLVSQHGGHTQEEPGTSVEGALLFLHALYRCKLDSNHETFPLDAIRDAIRLADKYGCRDAEQNICDYYIEVRDQPRAYVLAVIQLVRQYNLTGDEGGENLVEMCCAELVPSLPRYRDEGLLDNMSCDKKCWFPAREEALEFVQGIADDPTVIKATFLKYILHSEGMEDSPCDYKCVREILGRL